MFVSAAVRRSGLGNAVTEPLEPCCFIFIFFLDFCLFVLFCFRFCFVAVIVVVLGGFLVGFFFFGVCVVVFFLFFVVFLA